MIRFHQNTFLSAFLSIGSICTPFLQAKNIIHVSSTGVDTNVGTAQSPLATFQGARDAIRNLRQNDPEKRKQAFTVTVHPGNYRFDKTLELEAKEYQTTWEAAKPGSVFISGSRDFNASTATPLSDAEKARIITAEAREKILKIDLRKVGVDGDLGQLHQRGFALPYRPMQTELMIDGKILTLARWPNEGQKRVPIAKVINKGSIPRNGDFSNRGGIIKFNPDRIKQWKGAPDAWIYGFFAHGYSDDTVKIAEIDTKKKTIKTLQPSRYGFMSGKNWRSFHGFNIFEEIDQPGEYYIDRKSRTLYFYPPKDFDRKTAKLSLSMLRSPMIAIENTKNVTLRGFTFENTCGMGVYMEESEQCVVDQCTLRNIGLVAVVIGNGVEPSEGSYNEFHSSIFQLRPTKRILGSINERIYADNCFKRRGGSNNAIINSHIYNVGCGGIHIGGGDIKTLTPANNRVENCHIHDVNRVEKAYRSGVNLTGVGHIVRHNLIEDTTQAAIYFHGNDHVIEYNEFNRCMTYGDDHGVIYYGRNPAELGTVVRYNLFQKCGRGHTSATPVIYADDGACGITVHGNIFVRSGDKFTFLLGGGSFHTVYNNVFVDCAPAMQIGNRLRRLTKMMFGSEGLFVKRLEAVNHHEGVFAERYPFIANYLKNDPAGPKQNVFKSNILMNTADGRDKKFITFSQNYRTKINPGFNSIKNNDWSLTLSEEAKKVLGKDFVPPPFEKMGRYKQGKAPGVQK